MFFNKKVKLLEHELMRAQSALHESKSQHAEEQALLLKRTAELDTTRALLLEAQELHTEQQENLEKCTAVQKQLTEKYSTLIDKDLELANKELSIQQAEQLLIDLNSKYQNALQTLGAIEKEIMIYSETLELSAFGLYQRQFNFDTSESYKKSIEENYEKQKQLIKNGGAAFCGTEWTVSGSKAEGKKMTNQYIKLMLFAFNGECDGLIAKVKWNNATRTKERVTKAFENINKLGVSQNVTLTGQLLELKLEELALSYEYELKKYEEKEEQRRIREQMRDEEKAQRELEKAQKEAEDEEIRFQKALDKARQELDTTPGADVGVLNEQIQLLEQKLQEAHDRKERAISLAQLTKVGHIYVISNVGSFGENVYKIGMTRRLDPLDRVKELGDASVPFHFDVHAIIYSENAPQLEYELHRQFNDRRLNRINGKKEFFRITLDEIETFVNQHANAEIEFTKLAEAREYRETMTLLEQLNKMVEKASEPTKFPSSLI